MAVLSASSALKHRLAYVWRTVHQLPALRPKLNVIQRALHQGHARECMPLSQLIMITGPQMLCSGKV